jgi:uncharacterized repeat protein (TIGR01451 family)
VLGHGDGTFASAVNYAVGVVPSTVGVGDFNGDGKVDLAVADGAALGIAILLGNGDGTFAAAINYGGGNGFPLAVGDFNGDGKPDLVAASGGTQVAILLNTCGGVADLTITKTHAGNFTQGQTGATYTITVRNTGSAPTTGTVTVTDTLPSGLNATSLSGTGWNCVLSSLTCTRSDTVGAGLTYPALTLAVNVNSNAASSVINTATVSGGGEINTSNNVANDSTTVNASGLIAPTNLIASAASASQVNLTWNAVTTAVSYQVLRSANNAPYAIVGTPAVTNFSDTGRTANTTYLYQVQAVNGSSTVGPASNTDLATTILFTDDPVIAGSTRIKAVHLNELRTAVNAVRAAAGMSAFTFTDTLTAGVTLIKVVHVNELRSNLTTARAAIAGLPAAAPYTDPSLVTGNSIKAVHIQELRSGVK